MLTKEQIDKIAAYECDFDGKRTCANCEFASGCSLRKMADQAEQAIDLAAENEQLKGKLDAIKELCVNSNGLEWTWFDQILAIIDKDDPT